MANPPRTAEKNKQTLPARIEEAILGTLLLGMIVLACVQIFLRSFFSSGLLWADPLLRYLVLWCGLLGAAMATSKGKHIALDLISFLVPAHTKPWVTLITHLFSTTVAAFLTYAACLFIRNEIEFGGASLLSLPSWLWNLIFPIAFAMITLRFFWAALADIREIFSSATNSHKE